MPPSLAEPNEMISRVARAICRADGEPWDELAETAGEDSLFGYSQEWYRSLARAAITALREPTPAMCEAGFEHTGDPCWQEDVGKAWRAMIDEALKA